MTVGTLFLVSGFFHHFVMDRPANVLDFGMSNVIFSFAMGLLIACFGMYGRVSSKLPYDNPYWRRRHPHEAAREALAARRRARRAALGPAPDSAPAPALTRPRDRGQRGTAPRARPWSGRALGGRGRVTG